MNKPGGLNWFRVARGSCLLVAVGAVLWVNYLAVLNLYRLSQKHYEYEWGDPARVLGPVAAVPGIVYLFLVAGLAVTARYKLVRDPEISFLSQFINLVLLVPPLWLSITLSHGGFDFLGANFDPWPYLSLLLIVVNFAGCYATFRQFPAKSPGSAGPPA